MGPCCQIPDHHPGYLLQSLPHCWDWNVFSKSKLTLRWNLCPHLQRPVVDAWGPGSAQNDSAKELCWKVCFTLSAHSAWLPLPDTWSLLTFQTHLPLLLSMNTKQNKSPWFSTYAPGFLVRGECLCPFFSLLEGAPSHLHLPSEAVMTYSPASTHSPAHWVWCLPPYTSRYIEA